MAVFNTSLLAIALMSVLHFEHAVFAVRCPPLQLNLKHGRLIKEHSSSTRIRVRIDCEEGYIPAGRNTAICQDGKWSRKLPKCISLGILCPLPVQIENGQVFGNQRHVGAIVRYVCDEHYFLVGKDTLQCTWSYQWNDRPPVCQPEQETLEDLAKRFEDVLTNKLDSALSANSSLPADDRQKTIGAEVKEIGLDLVLVIDRSSSIDPKDFRIGMDFLEFLFRHFEVSNDPTNQVGAHFALVTFGDKPELIVNLDSKQVDTTEKAVEILHTLKGEGGGTALAEALEKVIGHVVPNKREKAKKAMFVVTDGAVHGSSATLVTEFAKTLRHENIGFEIFSIGIGRDINKTQLALISSEPSTSHVFYLREYRDFERIMWLIQNHPTPAPPPGLDKCGYIPERKSEKGNFEQDLLYKWPWLASIFVTGNIEDVDNDTAVPQDTRFCAGVLLCRRWILTAASCFVNDNKEIMDFDETFVHVFLGDYGLSSVDKTELSFYGKRVIPHFKFDPRLRRNYNLALIELNDDVPLNGLYRPVCLKPKEKYLVPVHLNNEATLELAGWGLQPIMLNNTEISLNLDDDLTVAPIKVVSCDRSVLHNGFDTSSDIFCTEKRAFGEDKNCFANIGSPLVSRSNLTELAGIVAWRENCAVNSMIAFTDVTKYYDWIDEMTDGCQEEHQVNQQNTDWHPL